MKSPLALGGLAALLIALLTAGAVAALTTGGTEAAEVPRLTEDQYEAQVNERCTRAFTELGAAAPQSESGALPSDEEITGFRDAADAIFAALLADLAALRPPERDDGDAEALVDLLDETWAVTYRDLLDAYIALDEGQTESSEIFRLQAGFQESVEELRSVATRLGVAACAGA